jgi:hypothetical protein
VVREFNIASTSGVFHFAPTLELKQEVGDVLCIPANSVFRPEYVIPQGHSVPVTPPVASVSTFTYVTGVKRKREKVTDDRSASELLTSVDPSAANWSSNSSPQKLVYRMQQGHFWWARHGIF